jgi:hypothetical protein
MAAAVIFSSGAGCDSGYSSATAVTDSGGGADAPANAPSDGGGNVTDGGTTPAIDATPTYLSLGDNANWTAATFGAVGATPAQGGAYDGRYVYYAPIGGTTFRRYDTTQPFDVATSWESAPEPDPMPTVFVGASFDGRYIVYAPFSKNGGTGQIVRFDTMSAFSDAGVFEHFDPGMLRDNQNQPVGGVHFVGAGRSQSAIYFSPSMPGTPTLVTHTIGSAIDAGYTATRLPQDASVALSGGVSAGAAYYMPSQTGVVLVATESPTGALSFSGYDYSSAEGGVPKAKGYYGAAFDGTYVYFAPAGGTSPHGVMLRHDTRRSVTDATSWESFDVQTQWLDAIGYIGAVFDGRYVTFVPYVNAYVDDGSGTGTLIPGSTTSRVVRYDTEKSFTNASGWESFDTKQIAATAGGYGGAIFDGQYIYFAADVGNVMLRFHAKTPASLPAQYPGTP